MMAPLNDDGVNYGTWINRNGEKEIYFDGATSGVHVCACHTIDTNSSCIDPTNKCNCDSQYPLELADEGKHNYFRHLF